MNRILDIYKIPGKEMASIVLEGARPLKLNQKSKLKKGECIIPIAGIPLIRPYATINTGTFGVIAKSDDLAVGDIVEIIE